jgi:asparagine synthase (glutamine-hydrolysing)
MHYCDQLRSLLYLSIDRCVKDGSDSLLLSGGLDSSILAYILTDNGYDVTAICIGYSDSEDIKYSSTVAERLGMKYKQEHVEIEDMLRALNDVVRIMGSFDPMEVRNSIVVYLALRRLRESGCRHAITGDGSDELFAGYNYMLRMNYDELSKELARLKGIMHFSSAVLGEQIGIDVSLPYLELKDYASSIPVHMKVSDRKGKRYGKFILRSCFEDVLGEQIAWRVKVPMEEGANTSILKEYFNTIIDDDTFIDRCNEYNSNEYVSIRNKEHLYYYEVYRRFFEPPYRYADSTHVCPSCKGGIDANARFCRICGAYPVKPLSKEEVL